MSRDSIQAGAARKRTWRAKFAVAFRGIGFAAAGQSSFFVHVAAAAAVVLSAAALRCTKTEWCILLVCITIVLAAEAFNSAIEALGRAINRDYDQQLGRALDMASGAVLITAIGAATVGLVIFLFRLSILLGWSL